MTKIKKTDEPGVSKMTMSDGTVVTVHDHGQMTAETKARLAAEAEAEHARHVAEKGHDCSDYVEHRFDPKSRLGDYYVCGRCGDLLQVG